MELCKKCGVGNISTRYVATFDHLRKKCCGCGYSWTEFPLDTKKKDVLREINVSTGHDGRIDLQED